MLRYHNRINALQQQGVEFNVQTALHMYYSVFNSSVSFRQSAYGNEEKWKVGSKRTEYWRKPGIKMNDTAGLGK